MPFEPTFISIKPSPAIISKGKFKPWAHPSRQAVVICKQIQAPAGSTSHQLVTMHSSVIVAALVGLAAASPTAILKREPAKCPNVASIGGTDAENSLCCVYGQSIHHCCRNKPFADDPYWSRALPCDSKWWNNGMFSHFYVCQVDPCDAYCAPNNVPYVYDGPINCPK
ncbi:hypothetical protein RB595_010341 [Gaeumannomyces hyphopodioides]